MTEYMDGRRSSDKLIELFYEEFKHFRTESKDSDQTLRKSIEDQSKLLLNHTEQLIKLAHIINGEGTKGLVARVESLERASKTVEKKISRLETQDKIRVAVLGAICTVCSTLGGIIAYCISVYIALHK